MSQLTSRYSSTFLIVEVEKNRIESGDEEKERRVCEGC
jgi:hypothetical protein